MLQAFIINALQRYAGKTITILVIVLFAMGWSVTHLEKAIDSGLVKMKNDFMVESTNDFYQSLEYSLKKQASKIKTDPGDLKSDDIEFLSIMCRGNFGRNYIPRLPYNQQIDAENTCALILDLYSNRA